MKSGFWPIKTLVAVYDAERGYERIGLVRPDSLVVACLGAASFLGRSGRSVILSSQGEEEIAVAQTQRIRTVVSK